MFSGQEFIGQEKFIGEAAPTTVPKESPADLPGSSSAEDERYHKDKALATPAVRRIARENKANYYAFL